MASLATDAKGLMDIESWLPPESPSPPGGTRLPHMFGALAHERMTDLVSIFVFFKSECCVSLRRDVTPKMFILVSRNVVSAVKRNLVSLSSEMTCL